MKGISPNQQYDTSESGLVKDISPNQQYDTSESELLKDILTAVTQSATGNHRAANQKLINRLIEKWFD